MTAWLKPCWQPYCRAPQRLRSPFQAVVRRHKAPHFLHLIAEDDGFNREKRKAIRPTPLHIIPPRRTSVRPSRNSVNAARMQSAKHDPPFQQWALPRQQTAQRPSLFRAEPCIYVKQPGSQSCNKDIGGLPSGEVCIYPAKISQLEFSPYTYFNANPLQAPFNLSVHLQIHRRAYPKRPQRDRP